MATDQQMSDYRNVFVPSNAANRNASLPDPKTLDKLELAYFIGNAKDLKYEFTKDFVQLSIFKISDPLINQSFFKLFKFTRDHYSNDKMNTALRNKISQTFPQMPDLEARFFTHLGI